MPKLLSRLARSAALALLTASCGVNVAGPSSGFSGSYPLTVVDAQPIPVTVTTGLAGMSMAVKSGWLEFNGTLVTVRMTGSLAGGDSTTTLGAQGSYTVIDGDSLATDFGVSGYVWSDSALVTTTAQTALGDHQFHFVKPSATQ